MRKVILIGGALASGKSTYSKILGEKYNLPVFNKDTVKERLSDVFGFKNREENLQLSKGTFAIMLCDFEMLAKTNQDMIIEANFHQEEIETLNTLFEKYNYDVLNIVLSADIDTLFKRFSKRRENENRHPCHLSGIVEYESFKEYIEINNNVKYYQKVLRIDANTFTYQNDEELFKKISDFLR